MIDTFPENVLTNQWKHICTKITDRVISNTDRVDGEDYGCQGPQWRDNLWAREPKIEIHEKECLFPFAIFL